MEQLQKFKEASMEVAKLESYLQVFLRRSERLIKKAKNLQQCVEKLKTEHLDIELFLKRHQELQQAVSSVTTSISTLLPEDQQAQFQATAGTDPLPPPIYPETPVEDPLLTVHKQFLGIIRECPVCLDNFTSDKMISTSCCHWVCAECFERMPSVRCPMCNLAMTACLRYELVGVNLKFTPVRVKPVNYSFTEEDMEAARNYYDDYSSDDDDVVINEESSSITTTTTRRPDPVAHNYTMADRIFGARAREYNRQAAELQSNRTENDDSNNDDDDDFSEPETTTTTQQQQRRNQHHHHRHHHHRRSQQRTSPYNRS